MDVKIIKNKLITKKMHHFHLNDEVIIKEFEKNLNQYLKQPYKIKSANSLCYNHNVLKEFKMLVNKQFFRVAYYENDQNYFIVLISDTLLKEAFCKELHKVDKVK